jgi:hypothetical protein
MAYGTWRRRNRAGTGSSAGHHHAALHAGVQVAVVAVLARVREPVAPGAPGLGLGGEPVPLDVVGTEPSTNRQVTSVPGSTSIAGGRNLRFLASTVVTPRSGGASAVEAADPDWQAANVNVSTSRRARRRRGTRGLLERDGQ